MKSSKSARINKITVQFTFTSGSQKDTQLSLLIAMFKQSNKNGNRTDYIYVASSYVSKATKEGIAPIIFMLRVVM